VTEIDIFRIDLRDIADKATMTTAIDFHDRCLPVKVAAQYNVAG
jgi:hypothetical protein